MKQFLPIAFGLGVFAAAGAGPVLARISHNHATQESRPLHGQAGPDAAARSDRRVTGATSHAAQLAGRSGGQDSHAPRPALLPPPSGTYLSHSCEQQKSLCDLLAY